MAKQILLIPAEIQLLTWLHIWGSDQQFEIWGIDNPVIFKPCLDDKSVEVEPYIPGSSIKWRLRALLEMYKYWVGGKSVDKKSKELIKVVFDDTENKLKKDDSAEDTFYIDSNWLIQDEGHEVSKLFWASGKVNNNSFHIPWNLIVKDFVLEKDYFNKFESWELILEEKMENTVPRFIDKNTNPRRIQRIPAWTKFVWLFVIVWNDENDIENKFELFKEWIELIEKTYLGGSWTRGYGSVRFSFYETEGKKVDEVLKAVYEDRQIDFGDWKLNDYTNFLISNSN